MKKLLLMTLRPDDCFDGLVMGARRNRIPSPTFTDRDCIFTDRRIKKQIALWYDTHRNTHTMLMLKQKQKQTQTIPDADALAKACAMLKITDMEFQNELRVRTNLVKISNLDKLYTLAEHLKLDVSRYTHYPTSEQIIVIRHMLATHMYNMYRLRAGTNAIVF